MEVSVFLLACVSVATALPSESTPDIQTASKSSAPTEALSKLNEGLLNHPALSQLRSAGNQPFLNGLPQPRYFIMPQSQGSQTNQLGDSLDPSSLGQFPQLSFINNRFLPFNFGSNGQTSQDQQQAPAQDAEANAKDSPAPQSQNEPSQPFGSQFFGRSNPLKQVFSLLG